MGISLNMPEKIVLEDVLMNGWRHQRFPLLPSSHHPSDDGAADAFDKRQLPHCAAAFLEEFFCLVIAHEHDIGIRRCCSHAIHPLPVVSEVRKLHDGERGDAFVVEGRADHLLALFRGERVFLSALLVRAADADDQHVHFLQRAPDIPEMGVVERLETPDEEAGGHGKSQVELLLHGADDLRERVLAVEEMVPVGEFAIFRSQLPMDVPELLHRHEGVIRRAELDDPSLVGPYPAPLPRAPEIAALPLQLNALVGVAWADEDGAEYPVAQATPTRALS